MGFSSLRCLRLCLRVCIFHTPLPLPLLQALFIAPCASGVIGALFPAGNTSRCFRLGLGDDVLFSYIRGPHPLQTPPLGEGDGGVAGEWCCTWRLCQYCKVCRLHRCEWVARGQNCGCLISWRDGISGSTATGDCGHRCRWEVRVVCAASSAIVTGSLGLRPQLPWQESWVCRNHLPVPSVPPPLCVPVHPAVAVQMYEFSGHMVFVLWMF